MHSQIRGLVANQVDGAGRQFDNTAHPHTRNAPQRYVDKSLNRYDAVDMRLKSTPRPTDQRYVVSEARVKPA